MNNSTDLISAVVTNFNHASFLDQRMESLLNQTYKNLEIIVIDNCSTDHSLEVLSKYKKYGQVKIVALPENGGYVNSCNMGIRLARGQFIIFAEADDYNEPSHVESLYNAMAGQEQIGVAFSRSFMVDAKGEVFDEDINHREESFKQLCSKDALIPTHLAQRFFLFSCIIPNMSAALIRRKYLEEAGGFSADYKACIDWDLWCKISRRCDFYYLASPLNYFRRHGESTISLTGLQILIPSIMKILYAAEAKSDLNFWEKLKFRVNIGVIWGRHWKSSPAVWLKSFPSVWRQSLKYDKLSLFFLGLAFMIKKWSKIKG